MSLPASTSGARQRVQVLPWSSENSTATIRRAGAAHKPHSASLLLRNLVYRGAVEGRHLSADAREEVSHRYDIVASTAYADLQKLVSRGFLVTDSQNKVRTFSGAPGLATMLDRAAPL